MPAPSDVALPTAVVVELGLALGVVDVVQPAQNTASASETATTKLATIVFFIFVLLRSAILMTYKLNERT
jgi:hypothetical protein